MKQSISTLLDLLTRPEFRFGMSLGIVGLMALVTRRGLKRRHDGWGVVLAFLVVLGLQAEIGWQYQLMAGMGVMGVGGWLKEAELPASGVRARWFLVAAWMLIVAGAGAVSLAAGVSTARFAPVTALAAIGIGWSLSKWTDNPSRRALGPLLAITAFGIWATIPETGLARLLLGVSVPMALTTIPPLSSRTTSAGGFALGGVIAWLVLWGGDPTSGSVVGAWACIGIIAVIPVASQLHLARTIKTWQTVWLHIVAVLAAARVIGRWDRAISAAIGSTLLAVALLVAIKLIDREPTPCE